MKGHPAVVVVVFVFGCMCVLNPTIWAAHPILHYEFSPPSDLVVGAPQIILISSI